MSLISIVILLIFAKLTICQNITDPSLTNWVLSTGKSTVYTTSYTNINKIQYSASYVYVSASGIPAYTIGPWPNNPNSASDQNWTFKIPKYPAANTGTRTTIGLGNVGVWTNGVTMFNANDGQSISGWSRNAYYFESSSFDACKGHPQISGVYHHHILPVCLFNYTDSTKHSPIVGFAFDGFPVYGPFGYSTASSSSSSIKRILTSYSLRSMSSRTTLANGQSVSGPSISTYPLGAFIDDYQYVSGSGDLDQYGGRYGVTPEYPSGTYAYFLPTDSTGASTYPYLLGLQYYGTFISDNSNGKATPTDSVTLYYTASSNIPKISFYCLVISFLILFKRL